MKTTVLLILSVVFLLSSCVKSKDETTDETTVQKKIYPQYKLMEITYIPDSLIVTYQKFIIGLVEASSLGMTTHRYKDVDETIEQAEETAKRIFEVTEVALEICYRRKSGFHACEIVPYSKLTINQKEIFELLKRNKYH